MKASRKYPSAPTMRPAAKEKLAGDQESTLSEEWRHWVTQSHGSYDREHWKKRSFACFTRSYVSLEWELCAHIPAIISEPWRSPIRLCHPVDSVGVPLLCPLLAHQPLFRMHRLAEDTCLHFLPSGWPNSESHGCWNNLGHPSLFLSSENYGHNLTSEFIP